MPLLLLMLIAATTAYGQGVVGDFRTPTGSVIRAYSCDSAVCLKLVRLPPDAPVATDRNNPDPALRSRPLCNLTIGTGFHRDGDAGHFSGGQLYDPKSGHTYHGTLAADGASLHLRGYIGVALFGRSETWQRIASITACTP
jgi:uncharacterized protein (DUF2147 family)